MTDAADLTARFGMDGRLEFTSPADGMAVADIKTRLCSARIALQGAQVIDWTPAGEKPLIWLSPAAKFSAGKSIRGGIPVCWPWFGAHADPSLPAHGFARTVPWRVTAAESRPDDNLTLVFELAANAATQALWPYTTPLQLRITLGRTLQLELITRNEDKREVTLSEALHTYFAVSDVRQVSVTGLDGGDYLDKVTGFDRKTQQGAVTFDGEVDRIYVDTAAECVIHDPLWQRRILIEKQGSDSTVVWNPWHGKATAMGDMGAEGYLSMLCVESGNAAHNQVRLAPGDEHRLCVRYSISR